MSIHLGSKIAGATLAAAVALAFLAPAAQATPYVATLTEQGGNVVANGSGEFDLAGLAGPFTPASSAETTISPEFAVLSTGSSSSTTVTLTSLSWSGPFSFGPGLPNFGDVNGTGTGDGVGIGGGIPDLVVPNGYTSGTSLTSGGIFDDASFQSLGITPGTYKWTWGSAPDQSFTLNIVSTATGVPEPGVLGIFGLGLVALGMGVVAKRRKDRQQTA